ncbi:L,D-transpeptidase family protein [Falsirhodobacter deserti]|uniref:L,D-transpeptidase family protein n=1 Tax=Falsirhodobacter deserti TaxID=1365611 RepID=UPI000FE4376D|nr:L,D-transpeptidase family protein [Falsirhodobacter deserti]
MIRVTPTGTLFRGRRFACTIGRGGVTDAKREGDMASPRGDHRIVGMLYRPDRLTGLPRWAQPIGPRDLWSDDPRDPAYNLPVRAPHPFSHEALRRPDPLYDLVLVLDWNLPATAGCGSAIFVHTWRRRGYPTAGCVAFAQPDLLWIARRIRQGEVLRIQ